MRSSALRAASLAAAIASFGLAPAAAASPKLAIFPVKLLDTSSEPADQRAAHETRLSAMTESLARDIAESRDVTKIAPKTAAACAGPDPQCLLNVARGAGAGHALIAVVHKSSSLIMQLFVTLIDVKTRDVLVSRELSFRGDTDESWRRAQSFLVRELTDAR